MSQSIRCLLDHITTHSTSAIRGLPRNKRNRVAAMARPGSTKFIFSETISADSTTSYDISFRIDSSTRGIPSLCNTRLVAV